MLIPQRSLGSTRNQIAINLELLLIKIKPFLKRILGCAIIIDVVFAHLMQQLVWDVVIEVNRNILETHTYLKIQSCLKAA